MRPFSLHVCLMTSLALGCTMTTGVAPATTPPVTHARTVQPAGADGACPTVRVFSDDNFQGPSHDLVAGRLDRSQLEAMGVENDTIRSVCVPPGWRVTLYEDEGFTGRTLELSASSGALGDFAQSATSVEVQPR